jgi:hypothetical protein
VGLLGADNFAEHFRRVFDGRLCRSSRGRSQ